MGTGRCKSGACMAAPDRELLFKDRHKLSDFAFVCQQTRWLTWSLDLRKYST